LKSDSIPTLEARKEQISYKVERSELKSKPQIAHSVEHIDEEEVSWKEKPRDGYQ
jgi:hypothetical protein